jgi:glycerophosphoryl diester phosphodiesterase
VDECRSHPVTFEVVAHRGVHTECPENTLSAFYRAIELGADAVELDVRLTRDLVPVVYHYFYLEESTGLAGSVFGYTWDELQRAQAQSSHSAQSRRIPLLREVVEAIGGQIGLEIELKGPEPECVDIIARVLQSHRRLWDSFELTSYEPALLLAMRERCPGLATDLLLPRSERWMRLDVVAHLAIHRDRLARARAVHLHPTQLSAQVAAAIRSAGLGLHAWDVNDAAALSLTAELAIPKICTDRLAQALEFRRGAART